MKKIIICLMFLVGMNANADFSGPYDVANWTQDLNGGFIDISSAPTSVLTISSNDDIGPDNTDFTISAVASGNVTFDWDYTTDDDDPVWDPFGYLINGVFTQLTVDGGSLNQSGTTTFIVNTGDVFGFRANSVDSIFDPATTTISSFTAPVIVTPENIPTLSTWGTILLSLLLIVVINHRSSIIEKRKLLILN